MFHLITSVLMFAVASYLYFRCIRPLPLPLAVRVLLGLVVLACGYKLQIMRALFPGSVVPEVPAVWLVLSGGLFALVILWAVVSLGWDICLGIGWFVRRWRRGDGVPASAHCPTRIVPLASPASPVRRVAVLFCLALLLSVWGVWEAVRVPSVRTVEMRLPHLPPALEGFKLVHLTDLHISALYRDPWARGVVSRVNGLKPDMVVITGDIIDGSVANRRADVAPLAHLRTKYGVYACLGNHEYYSGVEAWTQKLRGLGLTLLVNEHAVVRVEGAQGEAQLVVGGVADAAGEALKRGEAPHVAQAFAKAPVPGPHVLRVLLAHRPQLGTQAAQQQVNLQLSGHTHGGQLFPLNQIVAWFNQGYLAGRYEVDGMPLYISRGVGLWGGFPVRLGAPSEITEIILRGGATPGA